MPKVLRDAVHGDIELGPLELELIDTPEFQRLRGIKQLGTAYLVYPSAVHTRFEHSLGTAWMAVRLIEAVRSGGSVSREEAEAIRLAALLHDITHIPFGHTLEDERRVLPRHDEDSDRFDYFIRGSSIGAILGRHGLDGEVARILSGEAGVGSDIVRGPISADLLDYLKRDNYFCGLSQAYDPRIFRLFSQEGNRLVLNLQKGGLLRRDALSETVHLLRIRYTLTERVYFHHTKLASGAMISKAVELAMAEGLDPNRLRTLKDETLLWVLGTEYGAHPGVRRIVQGLESRSLYKPCYILTADLGLDRQRELEQRYHYDPAGREEAERAIAAEVGLEPNQIIVYCPSVGMSLPEAEVPARLGAGAMHPLSEANNEEIRVLKEKHRALWRFLVLLDRDGWELRERVWAAAAEYFGLRVGEAPGVLKAP